MYPSDLLNFFICIAPSFKTDWCSDDNYSVDDDGSYTFHGVCTEFSHYFIDQDAHKYITLTDRKWKPSISNPDMKLLFDWLENHIQEVETKESLKTPEGLLSNAICTCFLENISQTNAGEYAKRFMGTRSREYFEHWHVYNKKL
ncbi:hypothetical protein [Enterovibrio norvegicus]|uniref:hypothetical protein n=1 Tax=Enterovibrio norvegicus TaxID=188144 RepID=UPI0013D58C04|nr:hypothetical protein [Enterovibrio norvegicus]